MRGMTIPSRGEVPGYPYGTPQSSSTPGTFPHPAQRLQSSVQDELRASALEHVLVYAGCVLFSVGCWVALWHLCRTVLR